MYTKHPELWWELRNEVAAQRYTDYPVSIDGKYWKTFAGRKYTHGWVKALCERKTVETGKTWTFNELKW